MSLQNQRFAAHWKLPIISIAVIAVIAVGLAIALPASMASTHRTARSSTASPDQSTRNTAGVIAQAKANPATIRRARPSTGCLVTYAPSNWPGAFTVKVTIDNRGTTSIKGWKLTFAFPGDEAISSAWNATFTQTGARVSATNTTYDATIPPGARQALGFLGAWTSNDTAPTSFSVNGTACS
jgi:type II secretory pathway pseudopilin PulG